MLAASSPVPVVQVSGPLIVIVFRYASKLLAFFTLAVQVTEGFVVVNGTLIPDHESSEDVPALYVSVIVPPPVNVQVS